MAEVSLCLSWFPFLTCRPNWTSLDLTIVISVHERPKSQRLVTKSPAQLDIVIIVGQEDYLHHSGTTDVMRRVQRTCCKRAQQQHPVGLASRVPVCACLHVLYGRIELRRTEYLLLKPFARMKWRIVLLFGLPGQESAVVALSQFMILAGAPRSATASCCNLSSTCLNHTIPLNYHHNEWYHIMSDIISYPYCIHTYPYCIHIQSISI